MIFAEDTEILIPTSLLSYLPILTILVFLSSPFPLSLSLSFPALSRFPLLPPFLLSFLSLPLSFLSLPLSLFPPLPFFFSFSFFFFSPSSFFFLFLSLSLLP